MEEFGGIFNEKLQPKASLGAVEACRAAALKIGSVRAAVKDARSTKVV